MKKLKSEEEGAKRDTCLPVRYGSCAAHSIRETILE